MKKLMTALAVCAVAGFAVAQTVPSANVVGYNTVTLNPGFNMLAVNLDNVSAPTSGLDLNTLIPGTTTNLTKGSTSPNSDNVLVFSGGGYTTYYLYYSTKSSTQLNNQWVTGGALATNKFKSGDAFWYNLRTNVSVSVQFAGQVPNDASKTRQIVNGFNMLGSGYAADWDPNSLGASYWATNGAQHGSTSPAADNIMVFSSGGYTTYYLYYSTKSSTQLNNLWVSSGVVGTNFVKMGSGVWYNHRGSGFVLPQSIPYTL